MTTTDGTRLAVQLLKGKKSEDFLSSKGNCILVQNEIFLNQRNYCCRLWEVLMTPVVTRWNPMCDSINDFISLGKE